MSASIFSLSEHRANVADPVLSQVEGYWDGLRMGRTVPARSDINPRGLAEILTHCFILERLSTRFARFRVYGRKVSDLAGTELREMPISALFSADSREMLGQTIEQVLDDPSAARLLLETRGGAMRKNVQCHMTLLPLRDDLGDMTRILGCVSTKGDVSGRYCQLDIMAKTMKPLSKGTALASPAPLTGDDEDAERGKVVTLPFRTE